MSLTSYRAAPSRATNVRIRAPIFNRAAPQNSKRPALLPASNFVNGFFRDFVLTPATMPGDVLLFRCLSSSTIGAVRFHGRVRDGIGWVTDAMVTKQ